MIQEEVDQKQLDNMMIEETKDKLEKMNIENRSSGSDEEEKTGGD
jgi:hypothetical protein